MPNMDPNIRSADSHLIFCFQTVELRNISNILQCEPSGSLLSLEMVTMVWEMKPNVKFRKLAKLNTSD